MRKHIRYSVKITARNEHVALIMLVVVGLIVFASIDRFSTPDTQTIAHANASTNPYQPVQRYVPSATHNRTTTPQYSSSVPRDAKFYRKIIVLQRSVKTILRQLQRVEKSIDTTSEALRIATANNVLVLQDTLDTLMMKRDRLEQRLAETNSKLAEYMLQN